MMEFDLAQLRAFKATVEHGTLEAAARTLHLTPSAVSQRLKALETSVGRILLERTKPVSVTESGEAVLLLARQVEILSSDAAHRLGSSDEVRPTIPIAINADSLATWAIKALAEVSQDMCVEVFREDEEHTTSLLREGKVVAAVTSVARPVQGCTVARLGVMRYVPMASPDFIGRWFLDGVNVDALATAPTVAFDRKDEFQLRYLHRRWRRPLDPPCNYIPSSGEYSEAVVHGIGWGLIPELQASEHASTGRLVHLDPGESHNVKLYWQQWSLSSDALDRLAQAIKAAAKRALV